MVSHEVATVGIFCARESPIIDTASPLLLFKQSVQGASVNYGNLTGTAFKRRALILIRLIGVTRVMSHMHMRKLGNMMTCVPHRTEQPQMFYVGRLYI